MSQFEKDYFCSTSVYRKFANTKQAIKGLTRYYFGQYRFFRNKFFSHLVNSQAKVLEVGCGYSGLIGHFLRDGFNYTGVDVSFYIIDEMKKVFSTLNFYRSDVQEEKLDGTFDLILSMQVLEHLSHPEKALKNMLSVLKPGGLFLASVPNPRSKIPLTDWRADPTHVSVFPQEKWRQLLSGAGFLKVRSLTVFTLPFLWRLSEFLGFPFVLPEGGASILLSAAKPDQVRLGSYF